ncbi:conserved Plasmodium protein, unknown function [Plasmodium malariae]|uniref:Uncharacterized protein n=1 Tax=Plasmodium malariae TaxID=5858 RepID=A0A1A8WPR9_PLAMA|nr:conserved Plasmodium protein, unknown function [Plasmodium malariae]
MNIYNNDIKKKNVFVNQAIFFTPKKNLMNTSNEKKDIENKILQNVNDDYPSNNNFNNYNRWFSNQDQRKIENIPSTIWKGKDTILTFNTNTSNLNSSGVNTHSTTTLSNNGRENNNNINNTIPNGSTAGLLNGSANGLINGTVSNLQNSINATCSNETCSNANRYSGNNYNNNNNMGNEQQRFNVNSSLTNQGNNLNSSNMKSLNFLQKNNNIINGNVNNENNVEYLNISLQHGLEKKKDIVYLFQELLSYCECLKRSRKKSTEEINKIRVSYNKVSDLLKETLKREKNSHIKIEELRNIIINYDEKFDRVKNSSEGTITNLNKNVQTLIDLNNNLEIEMNKVVNENHQLRKIAQNEFVLNKEINSLRKEIEILNNEKVSLVHQIDGLRLENSKIENEKNVLLSDKTLLHCKIDELENGLKNRNNFFNKSQMTEKEINPFIINSDEEINEQLNNYLNLNHDQRTELFKNFLYHWRETNKAGQKFYEQSCIMN